MTNNQVLLKEIIEQQFNSQSEYTEKDEFFEFFSAAQILKDYNLSDEELSDGIVGGGNDGGCDSLYLFLNNEILCPDQIDNLKSHKGAVLEFIIIQSKNTSKVGENALMKWKTVSNNLMEMSKDVDDYKTRYVERVREMFSLFRTALKKLITLSPKINIKYYHVSLGSEVHHNVNEQADELKAEVKKMYPNANVSVDFITADRLMELYYRVAEENIQISLSSQAINLGKNNEFVSLVNLAEFYNFITDEDGNLNKRFFDFNVRDYQGNNAVNSSIAKSLESKKAEDFWWLNNGITVLSDKITLVTSQTLSIANPEIVNGLQTSTEIHNYFSKYSECLDTEKRNVLVRFIVPESEEIRDDIIFATNNQTNIPKSSLRVTDPIHLQIEMYCKSRGLYYDRRKNYYKNQKKKSSEIISVSFLAQCLISIFLRKPDFARRRPSTLLIEDGTYNKLYPKDADLSVYYKVAMLGRKVRQNIKTKSAWTPSERSDVLFYLLYGVVARVLGKNKITINDILSVDIDKFTDEVINDVKDIIYSKYKELGGNGRVAKSSKFVDEIDKLLGLA